MGMAVYKTDNKGLMTFIQKDLDDAFESLINDNFRVAMPDYQGWVTLEVELEDTDFVGERNETIERLLELKLLNEENAALLYKDEEIKQIIFAI